MEEERIIAEKQDSIKITKTSRGYSWEIKLYYDSDEVEPKEVIDKISDIDKDLATRFR